MTKISFTAKIEVIDASIGSWAHVILPRAASAKLGSKARVPVAGTINGFAFRTSAFSTGTGTHQFMVNKAMQAGAKATIGNRVKVTLEVDAKPRPVVIPAELRRALERSKAAKALFDRFPPSHKREVAGYVAEAKKAETRVRRAEQTVEKLVSGIWKSR